MELRRGRAGGAVAFAILLCALATASSEGRRLTAEGLFGNGGGLAKQVWSDCRNELMDRKEVPKNFDLYIPPEGTGDMKLTSLTRTNINKAIRVLPPQTKQELLDCLIKKSPIFPVSGKDSFNSWLKKGAELLYGWSNAPGSNLWRLAPGPARGAAPAGAPEVTNYGPAPSYSALASSPSPSPNLQPPIETPEEPPIPPDIINPPPPLSAHEHSPPSSHVGPPNTSKKVDDSSKRTIIVVAATAAVAVVIAALILLRCLRGRSNKIGPRDGQKDEGHLLTLNLSDFSAGSSQNTVSLGNSGNKEFSAIGGNNIALESDNHGSVADASSSHGIGPFPPPKPSPAPPPPGPPPLPPGPRPPPPPKAGRPPPLPPKSGLGTQPSPLGHHRRESSASNEGNNPDGESDGPKTKLKPFFWDKVLANPDHSMVWHEIKAGSFQFNEEKIESLFGYNNVNNNNDRKKESSSLDPSIPHIQIIDTKKARNLSILLRALNVTTEEVCDALQEGRLIVCLIESGNELPTELLETLLKMAPTADEELKLRLFTGDITQLGPAERFLKALVEIPFASKRLESLLFMSSLQEEISSIKESFATLEVACNKLRHSRLFLKLLEAVLKTGNRMNDGTFRGRAEAFKLDTLLKLADVKGTDGKITLLHFVVHEIIRSEGIRAVRTARASQSISSVKSDDFIEDSSQEAEEHYRKLGLQVVSGLSTELEDVKKAAIIDADGLSATVCTLGRSLTKTKDFLTAEMNSLDEDSDFHHTLASFVKRAEVDISWLLEEEKRIMALVKGTTDYFHGHAGKDEGLRLFAIIRDFLIMLDKSCKEVSETTMKIPRSSKKETPSASPSSKNCQPPSDIHQRLFPAIMERRVDNSSSDDESPSP